MSAEFSPAVRHTMRERADGWCEICGQERGQEHHHRRPRGAGGSRLDDTSTASNGLFICRACHHMVERHRNVARCCGWLVDQGDRPASVAVIYRGHRVLLDDLGNLQEAA